MNHATRDCNAVIGFYYEPTVFTGREHSPVVKMIVGQIFAVGGFNVQFAPVIFHGSITMRKASELQMAFFLEKWNSIFYVMSKSRGFWGFYSGSV